MTSNFDEAFDYVIKTETSQFTNDPDDSGGPTKWGITKKSFEAWVGHPVDVSEIKAISEVVARDFYLQQYWQKNACDLMRSQPIAVTIFDTSVLYGTFTSAMITQKVLNRLGTKVVVDGHIGPTTRRWLEMVDSDAFICEFREFLLFRISAIIAASPKDLKYREGWMNRANRLLTLCNNDSLIKSKLT